MTDKTRAQVMDHLSKIFASVRAIEADMPISHVAGFLEVARSPGITMKDLGHRLGIAQSTTSRLVAALSKVNRFMKPGADLVVATEDPYERRRKVVNLTRRGEILARQLESLVNEK
jgi:DNA-binding MarR family transcriptional regulator